MLTIVEKEVVTPQLLAFKATAGNRFLKGPIPWSSIQAAARLQGQALAVLLAINHRASLTRNSTVTLPKGLLDELGVSRDSKSRALRALEAAALISIARSKGRTARITLLGRN